MATYFEGEVVSPDTSSGSESEYSSVNIDSDGNLIESDEETFYYRQKLEDDRRELMDLDPVYRKKEEERERRDQGKHLVIDVLAPVFSKRSS